MEGKRLSLGFLLVLFALLWLPWGQHQFLIAHWMKVGTFMAPALLFMLFSERRRRADQPDFRIAAVIMLILYIVHQFEEHWVDLLGNHYAFYDSVNALLAGVLDQENAGFEVLTPAAIFVINTSLVWLVGFGAVYCSDATRFPALAMNGIILINAVTHIGAALATQSYNPGTLTSIVLFVPFSAHFYRKNLRENSASKTEVLCSLLWAFLAHVLMVTGLIGANWLRLFPEGVYFASLVAWSLLPMFLFRKSKPGKPQAEAAR